MAKKTKKTVKKTVTKTIKGAKVIPFPIQMIRNLPVEDILPILEPLLEKLRPSVKRFFQASEFRFPECPEPKNLGAAVLLRAAELRAEQTTDPLERARILEEVAERLLKVD